MNHSDKYKLIFFHIARAAGMSVKKALEIDSKSHPKHRDVWYHKDVGKQKVRFNFRRTVNLGVDMETYTEEDKWNKYKKFTIIRNPYDVVVSQYYKYLKDKRISFESLEEEINYFKNYVINIQNNYFPKIYNWRFYTINDKPSCNFYIRYENIIEDIKTLFNILKIEKYNLDNIKKLRTNIRRKVNNKNILIKGSRSIGLEKLIN